MATTAANTCGRVMLPQSAHAGDAAEAAVPVEITVVVSGTGTGLANSIEFIYFPDFSFYNLILTDLLLK